MNGTIKTNLRLTFPGGAPLSHGKAELMELIVETGSIRQAAGGSATKSDAADPGDCGVMRPILNTRQTYSPGVGTGGPSAASG